MFNNIKITLYITVFTCAHQVIKYVRRMKQNVFNRLHILIRSLSGLYTVVRLREGKRGTCLGPPFATVMCKVPCSQTGPQQQLQFANTLLTKGPKVTVMHKHFSFKGPLNFTDF